MNAADPLLRIRRQLIGHGALLIFFGGVIGFGFLFFLMGEVSLWPIPGRVDYQMPGTYDAWRMAHMEAIINGFGLWLGAAILPLIPLSAAALRRVGIGLIIVGWTIVLASALDPLFPDSRGLHFAGPATNYIAFFLFYIGVTLIMVLAGLIAWRCLRHPSSSS